MVWLCDSISQSGLTLENKLGITLVLMFITEVLEYIIRNKVFKVSLTLTFLVCLSVLSIAALNKVFIPVPELSILLGGIISITLVSCLLGIKQW
jgi:ABC-type enterochelin transport system permease subunit